MSFYRPGPTSFPPGAKVGLYRKLDWPAPPPFAPEGKPPIEPIEIAEADIEGGVTTQELVWDYNYWLAAEVEGTWIYEAVSIGPPYAYSPHELKDMVDAHAALTKGVHGIADTKALLPKPESPATFTQTYSTPTHTHAKTALATNLPTNLNVVTTLLGTLVTEVNTSNTRTNQIAEALNELKQLVNGLIDDCQAAGIVK